MRALGAVADRDMPLVLTGVRLLIGVLPVSPVGAREVSAVIREAVVWPHSELVVVAGCCPWVVCPGRSGGRVLLLRRLPPHAAEVSPFREDAATDVGVRSGWAVWAVSPAGLCWACGSVCSGELGCVVPLSPPPAAAAGRWRPPSAASGVDAGRGSVLLVLTPEVDTESIALELSRCGGRSVVSLFLRSGGGPSALNCMEASMVSFSSWSCCFKSRSSC